MRDGEGVVHYAGAEGELLCGGHTGGESTGDGDTEKPQRHPHVGEKTEKKTEVNGKGGRGRGRGGKSCGFSWTAFQEAENMRRLVEAVRSVEEGGMGEQLKLEVDVDG